ncbi:TolA-binding protein [Lysinibacillus composti]|uniref:Endolytic transglycosylase MltG n=1 Tax=Lysinibacillus composti TaxID=720633 RepID=A0A3N9UK48_9BACI|nr:hypothetical protein [Lysinibacillus composti]MBM7607107.1 TolA-binding protein [Lysinibacillus composti]RQW76301.1 hypothetical protein EBB45_01770 [Lysinibacillus composti]
MKRSSLRAFGIACFIIGLLYALSEQWNIPFISQEKNTNSIKYEEQIAQLEQKLIEANKQITQLKEQSTKKENLQTSAPFTEKDHEIEGSTSTKNGVVYGTLYIYSGLKPADVAQKLKDMGIVSNSVQMELFLAQPEYAKTIQKGQFELNSTMTVEEIAKIITGDSNK